MSHLAQMVSLVKYPDPNMQKKKKKKKKKTTTSLSKNSYGRESVVIFVATATSI